MIGKPGTIHGPGDKLKAMVAAPEILHVGLASAPSQAKSLNPHPWQQLTNGSLDCDVG